MTDRVRPCVALAVALLLGATASCKRGNEPPVIGSLSAPDSVYPGTDHQLSCAATDPENDPMSFTWTSTSGVLTPDTGTSVSWRAPDAAGTARITVKVKDTHGGEDSFYKDVVVTQAANRPPTITSVSGPDSVEAGSNASLTCNASDPDNDTLMYAWTCNVGGLSSPSGATVTWYAPDSVVSATITVIASDGQAADTATKNIGVKPVPNRPPVVDSISGPSSLPANGSTSLTCFAHDPDGDSLTYTWTCARGRLSPATGRTVTWYAPDTSGNVSITATVRDGRGGEDVRSKTISVTKVTTTWLDTMVSVPAQSSKAWYGTMKVGYQVWGSFSVEQKSHDDVLDICFYIMDSTNYYKWLNHQSSQGIVVINYSSGSSYSAVIPRTCRYYVVLDNTYSLLTPKIVTVLTKLTSP